jgi:hypothetical protein
VYALCGASAVPDGEKNDTNIDHRDGFSRSSILLIGVHAGARWRRFDTVEVWVAPNPGEIRDRCRTLASLPGPVVNKARRRQTLDVDARPLPASANAPLVSDPRQLVGDYTNPILKPTAAEVVKKHAEMSLAGVGYPSARNQCWPQGVPFIFTRDAVQLLQQADKITMLYDEDHEVRRVRMNQPHPAQPTPSWYGDSVGHYEGDTLVIDTVGFKIGTFSAVDQFGTPFTQALHVVERYRLIDYEAAKEAWERGGKENVRGGPIGETWAPDPNYRGKALQLQFTVEDKNVFTTAWSATKTYRRVFRDWPENVCAENPHKYNTEKDAAVPTADKPDF